MRGLVNDTLDDGGKAGSFDDDDDDDDDEQKKKMISHHVENFCRNCCIMCITVLAVMMQKDHQLKFDIAIIL